MAPMSTQDLIKEMKQDFKEFVMIMQEGLRKEMNEVREENYELKKCNENLQLKIDEVVQENSNQRVIINRLQENFDDFGIVAKRLVKLEDQSRQNNLRIDGISDHPRENYEQTQEKVIKLIEEKLDIKINLASSNRLGKFESGKSRTILARFNTFAERQSCLRSSYKLKGTNVFLNEDLARETLELRKQKLDELRELKSKGYIAYFRGSEIVSRRRPGRRTRSGDGDNDDNNKDTRGSSRSEYLNTFAGSSGRDSGGAEGNQDGISSPVA